MTWKTFEETIRQFWNRSIKAWLLTDDGGGSGSGCRDDDDDDDDDEDDDVKFILEEVMKAQRGSRGICILFL